MGQFQGLLVLSLLFSAAIAKNVNTPIVEISAGVSHACAIRDEYYTTNCWGLNDSGQLGDDSQIDSPIPVPVRGKGPWQSITTGLWHS